MAPFSTSLLFLEINYPSNETINGKAAWFISNSTKLFQIVLMGNKEENTGGIKKASSMMLLLCNYRTALGREEKTLL